MNHHLDFDKLEKSATLPAKIYIEPTSRCNLTCLTCIRNVWDEAMGRMTESTFSQVLAGIRAFPLPPVVFFGGYGEPLAHPQIVEMVAEAKKAATAVELITNVTFLTEKLSRQLIAAGLDLLWVSIDGATPESYADVRLGAALPEVLANITRFRDCRTPSHLPTPEIGIAFVAMKRNIADLPGVLRLGARLRATRYLVTNVLAHTEELRDEILYDQALSEIAYLPSSWVPRLDLPKIDLNELTARPLYQAMRAGRSVRLNGDVLSRAYDRCPFLEKEATAISWDGNLSPCLPLMHDHFSYLNGQRRFSTRYVVGNVTNSGLGELWNEPRYVDFRRRLRDFSFSPCTFCGGCDLSEANLEDCYGNTFPTCGGCLWAQGIIQCP